MEVYGDERGGKYRGQNGFRNFKYRATYLDQDNEWYVFCINPNDSQLPAQMEGRGVKGQVRGFGLSEIARRCVNVFEVSMTPEEFVGRYKEVLMGLNVAEGSAREFVEQGRTALGLEERDVVLGQRMVRFVSFFVLECCWDVEIALL